LVEVYVNDKAVKVPSGVTVLQACEAAGINIPRFCFHDRLSIAGNCRMCLVEVEKAKKPVASCAMPIMAGMKVRTDTDMVKFAREGVVEFLLANHPLDCPICDQGGECDLQDITITFGSLQGRYKERRRAVEDKDLGPFVKTDMNRCIHCTRCVRFADEIAGNEMLGTSGRGNATEIGTYVEAFFDSELSGNVIDLCPVGALTNRPAAFKTRPWDLEVSESIDVLEPTCANIVLECRFNELMRVKPRLNEDVNEEWISDKTRFFMDGIKRQRLDMCLVKSATTGQLEPATWPEALEAVAGAMRKAKSMKALAGPLACVESMVALKDLYNRIGSTNTESREDGTHLQSPDFRSDYLFNATIPGIEEADACLIVGCNPRMEAPLINARLRKAYLNGLDVALIGNDCHLNYDKFHLGDTLETLSAIANGSDEYAGTLAESERPLIIVGASALDSAHCATTMEILDDLRRRYPNLVTPEWNGISFLSPNAARNAALDIGFVAGPDSPPDSEVDFLYLLAADDTAQDLSDFAKDLFVVYQGSHGDRGAAHADVILPSTAFVEKIAGYVNVDGRHQRTKAVIGGPGHARTDWQILRALSEYVCHEDVGPLPYNNIHELYARLEEIAPHFATKDAIEAPTLHRPLRDAATDAITDSAALSAPFGRYHENFFATDHISRSSKVLKRAAKDLPFSRSSWA
jgi:NADH dehydrogenase (ubiquinone) Fe-S protein 1